jgi:hypothetical protein
MKVARSIHAPSGWPVCGFCGAPTTSPYKACCRDCKRDLCANCYLTKATAYFLREDDSLWSDAALWLCSECQEKRRGAGDVLMSALDRLVGLEDQRRALDDLLSDARTEVRGLLDAGRK